MNFTKHDIHHSKPLITSHIALHMRQWTNIYWMNCIIQKWKMHEHLVWGLLLTPNLKYTKKRSLPSWGEIRATQGEKKIQSCMMRNGKHISPASTSVKSLPTSSKKAEVRGELPPHSNLKFLFWRGCLLCEPLLDVVEYKACSGISFVHKHKQRTLWIKILHFTIECIVNITTA